MRSAISTAIIGTSPRRLQLYPSLGKHFQTTPVPVHFNGNKMMMKMQTTYSSHVLFCTKSSGGLSKQQDYSNTNTAVSLLPPTQETPKMILRRILVSIVSSAALLLYSSLFISHCFAQTMPYDNCSICEAVAEQLFKEIKEYEKEKEKFHPEQPYNDPVSHVTDIVEKVCTKDDWIRHINLFKQNNESQVCDSRCPKTICNEVMNNQFPTNELRMHFAEFICGEQCWDGKFESLKTHLCKKACRTGHDEPKKNAEGQVCDLGCRKAICNEVMEYVKSDFAKFINEQWLDGKFESLKTHLCENLTTECSTGHDEPKKVEHKHVEEPEKKKNEKNGWKKFKFWGRS